jgi:8-oxo-dGTP pyrophosphatase MutT (NUDIX family)
MAAQRTAVRCANCGGYGHIYRICNHPVTSFGIICFRVSRRGEPEYLMVQRKDSLCYVELIRGKYNLQNRGYITKLLANMTAQERERVLLEDFDSLWRGFWQQCDHSKCFVKEYEQSKARMALLKGGYYLRGAGEGREVAFFDLAGAISSTTPRHGEAEYGFPKGRRNIDESDVCCACREFCEETGMDIAGVELLRHVKPFEEVFTGTNRVRYRHVYYVAALRPCDAYEGQQHMPVVDPVQRREVQRVTWFGADAVAARIREENPERREMFRRVHALVCSLLAPPPPPPPPRPPKPAACCEAA